jgi:hypothetical protein
LLLARSDGASPSKIASENVTWLLLHDGTRASNDLHSHRTIIQASLGLFQNGVWDFYRTGKPQIVDEAPTERVSPSADWVPSFELVSDRIYQFKDSNRDCPRQSP